MKTKKDCCEKRVKGKIAFLSLVVLHKLANKKKKTKIPPEVAEYWKRQNNQA